jgi:hypothetical protein
MNLGFLFKLMFKLSILHICITSCYIREYLNFPTNYLNSLLTLQWRLFHVHIYEFPYVIIRKAIA